MISEVDCVFCDFGTSVDLLKEGSNRRMTLGGGGGTDGYLAPETKAAQYSFQVDMFAMAIRFNVSAQQK